MIRLFNKLYALCAIAACTILYSAWFLTSRNFGDIVPLKSEQFQAAEDFDQRLVVFGDSWSDNETEELQGKVWTDWLCDMFSCHQENLAQTASSLRGKYAGAVVDNGELDMLNRLSQTKLGDFKTQLQHWLDAEMKSTQGFSEEQMKSRQERTIFAISFGLWDVWSLVAKDYDTATAAVEHRVQIIMDQLNKLAERWDSDQIKIILTQSVDVTFLPAFASAYTVQGDEFKNAVKLLSHWNSKLREAAKPWDKGTIYLFDTNAFMMDRIRDWQYYAAGITAESGLGTNEDPGWENVAEACVESERSIKVMMSKDKHKAMCEHPDKYLFWNEMSLGPSAHRLMATEIYEGIDGVLLNAREDPKEASSDKSRREAQTLKHMERSSGPLRHSRRVSAA